MSEFSAALGSLQLKYVDKVIDKRGQIDCAYRKMLSGVKGIHCLRIAGELAPNYAYFPVLVKPEFPLSRDELYEKMKTIGVYPRRYFYPLISEFPMYRSLPSSRSGNLPVATQAASQILCLPIYPDLPLQKVEEICDFVGRL
jgi:dTDP-4-amino-4,6-dideoxygalactose transaminase